MHRRTIWVVGALSAVSVLTAAVALAATHSLSGKVTGSPHSFVTMNVVMKGKQPAKVTNFGAHAPATCQGGPPFATAPYPRSMKISSDGRFKGHAILSTPHYTGTFSVSGKVASNGKSATGTLTIDKKQPLPVGECKTGKRHWSARST